MILRNGWSTASTDQSPVRAQARGDLGAERLKATAEHLYLPRVRVSVTVPLVRSAVLLDEYGCGLKRAARSRCNAVRHGLTAETVIGALEDAEYYKAFEAAIIADYDVQSAVERELVLRLASLLWRLRRATTMETGLFDIQADYLREFRHARQTQPESREIICARFQQVQSVHAGPDEASDGITHETEARSSSGLEFVDPATDLTRCFLRLANLSTYPLDRLL